MNTIQKDIEILLASDFIQKVMPRYSALLEKERISDTTYFSPSPLTGEEQDVSIFLPSLRESSKLTETQQDVSIFLPPPWRGRVGVGVKHIYYFRPLATKNYQIEKY